ncbi:MAG: sulfotransferase domain-containing protein [Anaerolineales bacterium]|jgi:hypothetical protein
MEKIKNLLRMIRWQYRRARQRACYGQLDAPVFFGNAFPKSGTHLLTQVLAGFTQLGPAVNSGLPAVVMYEATSGAEFPLETILGEIKRYQPGDIGYGHLHAVPEIVEALCREGMATYFILRDPRDVAVSHVFYVTERESQHILHDYYCNTLNNFDERLAASIEGRPDWEFSFPDIGARFKPYMPWLERPEVLLLRFEDFITQKEETIWAVLDHAKARGFRYDCDRESAVKLLADSIDPQRSPTFRSGKIGGWREHFTPAHKKLFNQYAGDLLVKLGYESGLDW